ncbi:MAG TPA: hypothetical protein VFO83_04940, partial [Aggregicoccus sp.]|nr:hypothetical protein [Aggregicoccus sp.]
MRALFLSLLLLSAGAAHADWRALAVAGTPTDVELWRPGVFSVSTTSQAVLFENGVVTQSVPGESVGTLLTPDGCLLSLVRSTGTLVVADNATAGCTGPPENPVAPSTLNALSFARTSSGAAFAYWESAGQQSLQYTPFAATPGGWSPLPGSGSNLVRMADAVRVGDVDHALFRIITGAAGSQFLWYAGATAPQPVSLDAGAAVLETELFALDGAGPAALLATQAGLFRGVLGSSPTPFEPVALPAGVSAVLGLEVTPDAGSALGDGFGLAVAGLADGGHVLLNAVPEPSPADVARSWRANTSFPGPTIPAGVATAN